MFEFLMDLGNYDQRKVGRDDFPWGCISTAAVSDGRQPYETAVKHPAYRDSGMVIVEAYETRAAAEKGHAKWLKTMTAAKLPKSLTDCANSQIRQFCDALSGKPEKYPLRKPVTK